MFNPVKLKKINSIISLVDTDDIYKYLTGSLTANYLKLDCSNDPLTGNLEISKADPEFRLTDTGNNEYARLLRSDSDDSVTFKNRIYTAVAGNAISLDTSGEYGGFTAISAAKMTISFWYKSSSTNSRAAYLIDSSNNFGFYINFTGAYNGPLVYMGGSNYAYFSHSGEASDGQWHHWVVYIHGTAQGDITSSKFYIDNVEKSKQYTASSAGVQLTQLNWFNKNSTPNYAGGATDSLGIWTRELTTSEIGDLYNSGNGLQLNPATNFPSTGTPMSTNLQVAWNFDESSGASANDESSNNRDMTLYNTEDADWIQGIVVGSISGYVEIDVIKSENAIGSITGIQTLGNATGTTNIVGESQVFKIGSTTIMSLAATGLTIENDLYIKGQLIDGSNVNSIDAINRYLYDGSGVLLIDYNSARMYDATSVLSIDWQDRYYYDLSETISIGAETRFLYDTSGNYSLDWGSRATYDSSSTIKSIDWENRYLYDSSENESIDYENRYLYANDGATLMLDYSTNTQNTIGAPIRHSSSNYRRYYHMALEATNPGASGATWTAMSANNLCGWQLNSSTETLEFEADIHSDWDAASDLTMEVFFQLLDAGNNGDTVDLRLVCRYMGAGDTATKTQTVEVATPTDGTQYKLYKAEFTINYDETSNVVDVGDKICFQLNLETDTSEIDNILITNASFYYNTAHVGIESGDV
jgi:hypothetical protein